MTFRRQPYQRASVPLTPITRRSVVARVSGGVVAQPKLELFRSESYRRYVAAHPCFGCGIEGCSQAAHPNFDKGLAMKTDDRLCFPLCGPRPFTMGCHAAHDLAADELTRDERREVEKRWSARMQAKARADGRPEFLEAA